MNPLLRLRDFGQSVYLDELGRRMIGDGTLARLIEADGLRGVTSNPAIFEKAIAGSNDYDGAIRALAAQGMDAAQVYEELVVEDIRAAADVFRAQFDGSGGRYGLVSLEVSPHLANDTAGTIAEAQHLWRRLDRPNVFIKVPGTAAGVPAVRALIRDGVNVNVTLLFGIPRYLEVVDAYLDGLDERVGQGQSPAGVASVASFFLSRIDVLLDPQLQELAAGGVAGAGELLGRVAIANARAAYAHWQERFSSERFARLRAEGARPQELLWASTGTKNPAYADTMYVEPLIGPETINTMPADTLAAYRDHGDPADRLAAGIPEAHAQLAALEELGIDLDAAAQQLEDEGVDKFVKPFDSLLAAIEEKMG